MLDPRDHAFLSLAVTRGLVPEPRARELAQRYRGMPGGLAGALVDLGLVTAEARRRLEAELASAELRVPGFATTVATDEVIATPSSSSGLERGGPPPAPGFRTTIGTDEVIATPPSGGLFEGDAPPRPGLRTTVATDEVIATPPSAGVLESDEPVRPTGTQQTSILAGLLGPRVHLPGYELEAELGRGGMGIVHRARRLATGERVAIKLLLDVSPRHRQRFRREAAALERLSHPHVIGVLETGEAPDGQPYIIMPFAPGGDLRQAIARGLEPRKALEILAKVARAIAHAHDESVVHRDLKPGNVLLDEALEPKVTDFGLARILDHESQLTRTGVALGTPQYMAPEQVRCADPGPAADVHALGVMLFQLLTGEYPYGATGALLLKQIVDEAPPRPWDRRADVPRDLGELALAALEKDPADRPTAAVFAEALEAHLAGGQARVRPRSRGRRAWRRAAAFAGATLGGALVGLGLAAAAGRDPARADPDAVKAALTALDAALGEARRARTGRGVEVLVKEAEAHRQAAAHVTRARGGPPALRTEVEARYAGSGARARRLEVLAALAPTLLPADPPGARALARERLALEADATSLLLLARALAAEPATGAEACRLAVLAAAAARDLADLTAAELIVAQAAETLLALHRPTLAARALEGRAGRSAGLVALRARALLESDDVSGAREALEAQAAGGRDGALVAALARCEVRLGRPDEALTLLAAHPAGGEAPWHLARAAALEARGDAHGARAALDDAVRIDPARAPERGRFLLRRGRPTQALEDLRGADAAARLDAALTAWLLGGGDEEALRALRGVTAAAAACNASPAVGAAAARWAARVEAARGRTDAAVRLAAAARDLEPGPAGDAALAWALLRAARAEEALAALGPPDARTLEGRTAAAQALLALGRPDEATAVAADLPGDLPARADLERALALRHVRREAVAPAERAAFDLRRAPLLAPAPCPAPVASAPHDDPSRALVERLWVEVRRAQGEPARRARLLARLLALDPEHAPARLDQAVLDADAAALDRLAGSHAHLVEVRRAHLRARLTAGAPGDLEADLPLLADLGPDDRLRAVLALVEARKVDLALDVLRPALEAEPRHVPSLRALAQVASARGDAATAAAAERAVTETEAVRRREALVRRAAVPSDTRLVEARDALEVWRRHLEHDAEYLMKLAQYENNSARPGRSIVAAGRYLVAARAVAAHRVSYWTYAFGYVKVSLEGETVLDLVARELPARPDDPALFAARALYLLARHHSDDAQPGDALAAADAALRAVDLSPGSPGLLTLAADAVIEADEPAEAGPLLRRALTLDPGSPYAVFQQARLAARAGDLDLALRLLELSGRPDHYDVAGYTFARDPCFARVRDDPRFKEYLSR